MNELQRLLKDPSAWATEGASTPASSSHSGHFLRVISSADKPLQTSTTQTTLKDWSALVDSLRVVGQRTREIKARARAQEAQFEDVLQRARDGITASNERARSSETMAQKAHLHAETRVTTAEGRAKVAEERARAAEDRARHAEAWLTRVQETILSEFSDAPEQTAA